MPTLLEDRVDAAPEGARPATRKSPSASSPKAAGSGSNGGRRPRRRLPSLGSIVAALGIGVLALVGFLIVGALTGLFSIGNPFSTSTVDRSQPALLKQINDLVALRGRGGQVRRRPIDIEHDVVDPPVVRRR